MSTSGVVIDDIRWQNGSHDSKVRGANMGPISGRQDPGGPHVGPRNFAIWFTSRGIGATGWFQLWSYPDDKERLGSRAYLDFDRHPYLRKKRAYAIIQFVPEILW